MKYLKVVIFLIIIQIPALSLWAQEDNSEYRYLAVKFGVVGNVVPFPNANSNLLARTPLGDMALVARRVINVTPGGAFSIHYHIDAKSNRFGIVLGAQVQNFGYSIQYMSLDSNFYATDAFRSTSIVIPFYIKYNPRDIFINQSYLTVGFKQYINLNISEYQSSTWIQGFNVKSLSQAQIHRLTSSFFLGYNYYIYYFELEYTLRNFVNKDFKTTTGEGVVRPFSNIDYRMNIYFTFGVNIPINRWTTMRNWTAEKIRRMFTPVR